MSIGSNIALYRKKLNITQEVLAVKLGVTNQAVSKWESDQCCPDIQLLPDLADIFGITIDELFDRTPKAAPQSAVIQGLPWENDDSLRAVLYMGHTLVEQGKAFAKEITFTYEGKALNIISAFTVNCGDVAGDVDAGRNVNCGDVGGDADAGGGINCGNVGGDVDAGTSINCGNADGDVSAGGSISCGDVAGDVDAGGYVSCGNVGGDVDAGCQVECTNVEGDINAGGGVYIRKG